MRATILWALALTILLLAPSILPATTPQAQERRYIVIAMPFFLQESLGSAQAVFVYGYEHLEFAVDLNYNGKVDPGEPYINKTRPGEYLYAAIGVSSIHKVAVKMARGPSPLWILVPSDTPVSVGLLAADSSGYKAAYHAPPPGTRLLVPGLPGKLYLTPATPEGARVSVTNETGKYDYTLAPGQVLVFPTGASPVWVESDKPVSAALYGGKGRGRFLTEIIPLDQAYALYDLALPLHTDRVSKYLDGLTVYTILVEAVGDDAGNYTWLLTRKPASYRDYMDSPGIAYIVAVNSKDGIAVTPVYNLAGWSSWGFRSTTTGLITYTSWWQSSSENAGIIYVPAVMVPDRAPWLAFAQEGDYEYDVLVDMSNTSVPLIMIPAHDSKARMLGVMDSVVPILYYRNMPGSRGGDFILRTMWHPLTPDQASQAINMALQDSSSAYYNKTISPFHAGIATPRHPVIAGDSLQVTIEGQKLLRGAAILALVDSSLEPVSVEVNTSLSISLKARLSHRTNGFLAIYYAWTIEDGQIYAYKPTGFPIPADHVDPKANTHAAPTLATPRGGVEILDPEPEVVSVSGGYYHREFAYTHLSDIETHLRWILGVSSRALQTLLSSLTQPAEEETTTTKPPETTTPIQEETTSIQEEATETRETTTQTTPTTSETVMEETRAETGGEKTHRSILQAGDTITYKITIGGKGPEGEGSWTGILTLKVVEADAIKPIKNTLSDDARALATSLADVSDVFQLAGMPPLYYSFYPHKPSSAWNEGVRCPLILQDGIVDKEDKGTIDYLGLDGSYACKYTKGVLVQLEFNAKGKINGQDSEIHAKIELANTTIKELQPSSLEGLETKNMAIAGLAAAIIIAIAIIIHRRR